MTNFTLFFCKRSVAVQDRCRRVQMQDRTDAGQDRCMTGPIKDRMDAGQDS